MPEFIDKGYIRAIDESTLEQADNDPFISNVLDTCRDTVGKRHGLWALPFNSDAGLMYFRSDLGVAAPKTWDDYFGTAARNTLTAAKIGPGAAPDRARLEAATSAQLADEEVLTVTALEAMFAEGSEVVNHSGNIAMNADRSAVSFDQNALAGLRKLAKAAQDPAVVLADSTEADEGASARALKDGRALFMRNWPVAYDDLLSRSGQSTMSFGVERLPWTSVLGGQNLAIATSTDKPHAAQALIEFLTSPSSQLALFEIGGYAPTRNSAFVNSRRSYGPALRDAIEHARPRPALVNYTEFSMKFRKGIKRALNNHGKLEPDFPQKLADIIR